MIPTLKNLKKRPALWFRFYPNDPETRAFITMPDGSLLWFSDVWESEDSTWYQIDRNKYYSHHEDALDCRECEFAGWL